MSKKPKKPEFQTPRADAFWRHITRDYDLEPQHYELLREACVCLDRLEGARAAIDRDGEFFTTKAGAIRPHPGLALERDSRTLLARMLRELRLDDDSLPDIRPPRLGGRR
jgi:phage terminase small subunit